MGLIFACSVCVSAQTYNRIQYHHYHWQAFHTNAFQIYFQQGNDSLCAFIAREYKPAEKILQVRMGTSLTAAPNIIIYPSIDQQYETNIGSEEPKAITLPTFIIGGNRMLLYFNGSYEQLKGQLYEAIARSIWEQQTNTIADQANGSIQSEQIPYWFKEGAIRYFAHQWPLEREIALFQSFATHHYTNWNEVVSGQRALTGQAFCYFLTERFLPTTVMQTYFQIRKHKTLPASLRLITKTRIDSLTAQCFSFYRERYNNLYPPDDSGNGSIAIPHKRGIIRQVLVGRECILYVLSTAHKRSVFTYDQSSHTTVKLATYQMPPWIADHTGDQYPLVSWTDDKKAVWVTLPVKGKIDARLYSINVGLLDKYALTLADGILRMVPNGNNNLLMAAWAQATLDTVNFNTRRNKFTVARLLTRPALDNNKWMSNTDSLYVSLTGTAKHEYENVAALWLADNRNREAQQFQEDSILKAAKDETPGFLDGVFGSQNNKQQAKERQDSIKHSLEYSPKKVQPYVLQLHSAYFSAKVNNDYYINRYQPYLNYQGQFKFPEVGGMAQGGLSDLFENHHFTIAYRMPAGTEGSDFFVKYRNTAKRLDWELTYFRKVESLQPDPKRNWLDDEGHLYPNAAKVKTNYYEMSVHYPLSFYSSLNFTTALRNDRTIFLASENYSLKFAALQSNWSISSLNYEINKLRPTLPLLYRGFSAKATVDLFKGFSQKEQTLTGNSLQLTYHQPLHKYITLVTRLLTGYSGGNAHVLYNLGGVDNNITPRIDSDVHFPQDAPFAFTTLVAPFRGYFQNSLYGNEYALLNVDVYFPLFQTLIPIETPLSSINNLQLGLFTDMATAKETWRKPAVSNGIKSAYGFSARTTLAGYPLRIDMAWPGDGNKALWYLSINRSLN